MHEYNIHPRMKQIIIHASYTSNACVHNIFSTRSTSTFTTTSLSIPPLLPEWLVVIRKASTASRSPRAPTSCALPERTCSVRCGTGPRATSWAIWTPCTVPPSTASDSVARYVWSHVMVKVSCVHIFMQRDALAHAHTLYYRYIRAKTCVYIRPFSLTFICVSATITVN